MMDLDIDQLGPQNIRVTRLVSPGYGHTEHVEMFVDAKHAQSRYNEHSTDVTDLQEWMAEGVGFFLPDGWDEADDEYQDRVLDERDKAVAQWWKTDPLAAIRRWFAYDDQSSFIVEYVPEERA